MRRSVACKRGLHNPASGMPSSWGRVCRGYAGPVPCECPCHKSVADNAHKLSAEDILKEFRAGRISAGTRDAMLRAEGYDPKPRKIQDGFKRKPAPRRRRGL
jgi:hypothetical protein